MPTEVILRHLVSEFWRAKDGTCITLKDRTCIFFTMATVLMTLPKLYLLRWYLDLGFGFRSSGYQDTRKLTGLSTGM